MSPRKETEKELYAHLFIANEADDNDKEIMLERIAEALAAERKRILKSKKIRNVYEALRLIEYLPDHRNNCVKFKPDGSYCEKCFVDVSLKEFQQFLKENNL